MVSELSFGEEPAHVNKNGGYPVLKWGRDTTPRAQEGCVTACFATTGRRNASAAAAPLFRREDTLNRSLHQCYAHTPHPDAAHKPST